MTSHRVGWIGQVNTETILTTSYRMIFKKYYFIVENDPNHYDVNNTTKRECVQEKIERVLSVNANDLLFQEIRAGIACRILEHPKRIE